MTAAPRLAADALLFDLDGLMIDSEPLWLEVERDLAAELGLTWTPELARACVGTGLPNTIRTLRERLGAPLEVAEGVERLVEGFLGRLDELRLKPGCAELVAAVHGRLPLAVASSATHRLVCTILDHFALTACFDAVVTGDRVARTKPAPDVFLHAAERLGRRPAGCVVLEDSVAGVTAACAAGMRVIAVPEHEPERFAALTDLVVADLHAARALLGY